MKAFKKSLCPWKKLYLNPQRVWTVPSLSAWNFWKNSRWFRPRRAVGFHPTARRVFFPKFSCIHYTGTELSTVSGGFKYNRSTRVKSNIERAIQKMLECTRQWLVPSGRDPTIKRVQGYSTGQHGSNPHSHVLILCPDVADRGRPFFFAPSLLRERADGSDLLGNFGDNWGDFVGEVDFVGSKRPFFDDEVDWWGRDRVLLALRADDEGGDFLPQRSLPMSSTTSVSPCFFSNSVNYKNAIVKTNGHVPDLTDPSLSKPVTWREMTDPSLSKWKFWKKIEMISTPTGIWIRTACRRRKHLDFFPTIFMSKVMKTVRHVISMRSGSHAETANKHIKRNSTWTSYLSGILAPRENNAPIVTYDRL